MVMQKRGNTIYCCLANSTELSATNFIKLSMSIVHYFAYGSNLHPVRLTQRIPSAQLIGTGKLPGYQLTFQKRGQDDSGKGHIATAPDETAYVLGAVYQLAEEHKANLDIIEGTGYETTWFEIDVSGNHYSCFAYIGLDSHLDNSLKPYRWYKSLIVLGAEYHGFPAHYVNGIQQTRAAEDPDSRRRKQHEMLLADMLKFQK